MKPCSRPKGSYLQSPDPLTHSMWIKNTILNQRLIRCRTIWEQAQEATEGQGKVLIVQRLLGAAWTVQTVQRKVLFALFYWATPGSWSDSAMSFFCRLNILKHGFCFGGRRGEDSRDKEWAQTKQAGGVMEGEEDGVEKLWAHGLGPHDSVEARRKQGGHGVAERQQCRDLELLLNAFIWIKIDYPDKRAVLCGLWKGGGTPANQNVSFDFRGRVLIAILTKKQWLAVFESTYYALLTYWVRCQNECVVCSHWIAWEHWVCE